MDKDLIHVLERIANGIEENNIVLNNIANHYDGIVPVMKRNQVRVEEAHNEAQSSLFGNLFGEPKGQEN